MIVPKMAFRNIFRQRRRSLLTGLMMMGGFTLCSVSLGISDGSYGYIIDLFTKDHTGHIQIHKEGYLEKPSLYSTIDNWESMEEEVLEHPDVESMAPRIYSPALAFVGNKTTGAQIVGIDPVREPRTTRIRPKVSKGRFLTKDASKESSEGPSNEVIIGESLAEILKVGLDDEIYLLGQGADGSIANDVFKVTGIIPKKTGSYDKIRCYMHLAKAQEFLTLEGRVHEVAVLLRHQKLARNTASEIRAKIDNKGLSIDPWQVVEKDFFKAMQVDMKGNYITQGVIILIVAIGVLDTVLMSILERTREFGVMRAVGTRPVFVFKLIVLETFFLCIIAVAVGAVISLAVNYYFSVHGIKLPTPVDYGGMRWDTMLSEVNLRTLWIPALVTSLAALTVSVFPAIRASRITPVKAMREH